MCGSATPRASWSPRREGRRCPAVAEPELWGPGRGYLYDLEVELIVVDDDDDADVDRYVLPVGIRTVRVEGTQFLINDEPFYFRGFGKHEDLNVHGRGHDDAAMVHDFALLGWIGANSFRTSHYPYAEEVLEHADRLGIVVIDETAAVGLNLGVGGGLFLGGPKDHVLRGNDRRRHPGWCTAGPLRS